MFDSGEGASGELEQWLDGGKKSKNWLGHGSMEHIGMLLIDIGGEGHRVRIVYSIISSIVTCRAITTS